MKKAEPDFYSKESYKIRKPTFLGVGLSPLIWLVTGRLPNVYLHCHVVVLRI